VALNSTDEGDKARTLMAGYYKYGTATLITNKGFKGGTTCIAEPIRVGCLPSADGKIKNGQAMRVYDTEGKSVSLKSQVGGLGAKTGLYAIPVNTTKEGKSQTIKAQYQKTSPANILGYTSTYGTSGVAEPIGYATPIEWDENGRPTKAISGADGKTYTAYEVKNGIITIKGKEYPIKLANGFYIIRKLTVKECMRLQTVPEWYQFPVSDTQAYKMLGNGWTVDVIAHILTHIEREEN
jgi:DNA (cytosine-5)-methyltransferase 3A